MNPIALLRPARAAAPDYAELMRACRFPGDLRAMAFAGIITESLAARRTPLIRGMGEEAFARLMRSCFPGILLRNGTAASLPGDPADDEFDDLLNLLLDHRSHAGEIQDWLSIVIASASMHEGHLWQDLGLPDRATLTLLLRQNFPDLAAGNTGNMKWKKYFYRCLCARAGLSLCRSPNCAQCPDYALCFGPEAALPGAAASVRAPAGTMV